MEGVSRPSLGGQSRRSSREMVKLTAVQLAELEEEFPL